MEDFKKKYVEEAYEVIASLEESILKLEQNRENTEVVEDVFRSMHTLKGGAAMFGFDNIRDATHELENAYDQIRSGKASVTKALLDITLEGIDYFKNLLEEKAGSDEKYHEQLLDRINKILEGKADPSGGANTNNASAEHHTESAPEASSSGNDIKQDQEASGEKGETSNGDGQQTQEQSDEQPSDPSITSAAQGKGKAEDQEDAETAKSEAKTYHIYFSPNKDILKNGTNPLILIEELVSLGTAEVFPVTSSIPGINDLAPDELFVAWHIIMVTEGYKDEDIADVFMFVEDDSTVQINLLADDDVLSEASLAEHLRDKLSSDPGVSFSELQNIVTGQTSSGSAEDHADTSAGQQTQQEVTSGQKEVFFEDEAGSGESEYEADKRSEQVDNQAAGSDSGNSNNDTDTVETSQPEASPGSTDDSSKDVADSGEPASSDQSPQQSSTSGSSNGNGQSGKSNAISSIRISSEKVDELMNLVSELVTTQARLNLYTESHSSTELEEINENIHKLTSQLRDNAFDLSLIPLQSIVTRFQRLVRDLSGQLGKEVNFETEGTDTELDKSIIEHLVDPILHILRNSLDHGIEDAETRRQAGKPEKGTIRMEAYHSGTTVHIDISDDGRGLDVDAIRQKGINQGLISSQAQLTRSEIFDLIFHPGFSTNNSVTDVSGRGVGMDVVKETITSIRGEVDVDSQLGKGTRMTIKLPLTLSIVDGLLVDISDTKYIVPLNVVDKIYPIKHSDLTGSFFNLLVLDGKQMPYYYLRKEFNIDEEAPDDEQVIVVSHDGRQTGIVIDKVIGEYQAVLKPLGKHYRKIQFISGATILGDGSVALVMDTNKIISHFSAEKQKNENAHIN